VVGAGAGPWAAGAVPVGPLRIDLDATLLDAHADKQGAAGTFKHGFGFHPLVAWLDRGDGTGEALAGIQRRTVLASQPSTSAMAPAVWPRADSRIMTRRTPTR
jgi:hypothetical protein